MKAVAEARPGIWNRSHYPNNITLRRSVVAYFQYDAIQAYHRAADRKAG